MHAIVVVLTIVGMLLCPYDCAVREAAARSTLQARPASPHCCRKCRERESGTRQTPAQEHDRPSDQRPADDGRFCICEGAVFDSAARELAVPPLDVSAGALIVDAPHSPILIGAEWFARLGATPPHSGGGRQVRIAVQSFLL